jgi:SAM-dependent methyltransferase
LSTGAYVFSFDLSTAVDANFGNNGANPRLYLGQADILNLPAKESAFDGVICLGVLQHTPDPAKTFAALSRHVKPGGSLVIDCYANNWKSMLHWKYVLRPLTKRVGKSTLYKIIEKVVPVLLPLAIALRKLGGRAGGRLLPILQYSHWGLPYEQNKQWAILDTFDMYSPEFDRPQSLQTVRTWFEMAGFVNIEVRYGPNGVIGRGMRPANAEH